MKTSLQICRACKPKESIHSGKAKRQHGGQLLGLPSEIRALIYEQMFPRAKFHIYAINGSLHKEEHRHYTVGECVAVLATCRAIYEEAKPVLYNRTEFCILMRDEYWLHSWDELTYKDVFGCDDVRESPDPHAWIAHNPWLLDPRSIVPVSNIRILTLYMSCTGSLKARNWTWTAQLRHTLLSATKITKLHIDLDTPHEGDRENFNQSETNLALDILGQTIKCDGIVTAAMDPSLGIIGFDSEHYWKMLTGFKGIDKSFDAFSAEHEDYVHYREILRVDLKSCLESLRSETEECIKFSEGQSAWINYNPVVSTGLSTKVRNTLARISSIQSRLRSAEQDIETLEEHRKALKVEKKSSSHV